MAGFFGAIKLDFTFLNKDLYKNELINNEIAINSNLYENHYCFAIYSNFKRDAVFFDESNEISILFYGEIYNANTIKKKYSLESSITNPELILQIYQRNKNFVNELNCAFSFLIVDGKKNTIECYRDHLGIKPLFYSIEEGILYFASEIKYLKPHLKELTPNKEMIATYLAYMCGPPGHTFFNEIKRVPKASKLLYSDRILKLNTYFRFEIEEKDKQSEMDYIKEFKDSLTNSCLNMLSKKDSIGCKLSGGLDSTTLSSILYNSNIDTKYLSVVFSGFSKEEMQLLDESEFIDTFYEDKQISGEKILVNKNSVVDPFLYSKEDDEPKASMNRYFDHSILEEAKKKGLNKLVDGFDGDSVVTYGLNSLYELARKFNFFDLYHAKNQLNKNGFLKMSQIKFFLKFVVFPFTPRFLKKFLSKKSLSGENFYYLSKEYRRDFPLKDMQQKLEANRTNFESAKESHLHVLNWQMWEYIFETSHHDSAKYNIEEVYPFMNVELMQICLNLPNEMKLKNGWTRYILRESFKDYLPNKVYKRSGKTRLNVPVTIFFDQLVKRNEYYDEIFSNETGILNAISPEKIKEIYSENKKKDYAFLYQIISLNIWLKSNNFKL